MKNMSRGPVFRTLLSFALPLFLGNVFQQLYSLVDAWAVGADEGRGLAAKCLGER